MDNFFEKKTHRYLIGILVVLSYFLLMFGNGMVSLTHPDEVFYIQSAKEMVQYNKWFTPMIFDEVQFEKPFLAFALFAGAIKWFGLNSVAARFWPAFFGMLGVGIVYWISWLLFKSKRAAFFSGLILTTSFIYMALSRAVLTDMIFSVIVAISIGFFYQAYVNQEKRDRSIIWGFIFSAIAVLTKGLLGICFPFMTVFLFMACKRDFSLIKTKGTLIGFILFLIISVPWHVVMYMQNGQWFLEEYFHNVHFRRILAAEHKRLDNWYFYLALMFAGVLPWSLFWVPTIKTIVDRVKQKSPDVGKIVFLVCWIVSVYIFTQPATSKLASYIFPAFPAIAILLAYYLNEALTKSERGEGALGLRITAGVMATVLFVGIFVGIMFARHYIDIVVSMTPVYITAGCVLVTVILLVIFNLTKQYQKMLFSFLGINFTLLLMLFLARPYIEPWVSCKDISDVFKTIDQSDSTVIASKFYVRGVRYYTDRKMAVIDINGSGFWSPHPIPFMNTDQMVLDLLNKQKVTYAVVKEGNVEDLKRILKGRSDFKLEELDGIGGKFILRITKLVN